MQQNYVTNVKIYKKKHQKNPYKLISIYVIKNLAIPKLPIWRPGGCQIKPRLDIFGWKLERQFLDLKIEYAFPVGSYGSHQGSTNKFY